MCIRCIRQRSTVHMDDHRHHTKSTHSPTVHVHVQCAVSFLSTLRFSFPSPKILLKANLRFANVRSRATTTSDTAIRSVRPNH